MQNFPNAHLKYSATHPGLLILFNKRPGYYQRFLIGI